MRNPVSEYRKAGGKLSNVRECPSLSVNVRRCRFPGIPETKSPPFRQKRRAGRGGVEMAILRNGF